ncbi:Retrovirus-related Pol polyprotein from transposon TNT 1-94 [Linum perenne]
MKIEEANKQKDKDSVLNSHFVKANLVESGYNRTKSSSQSKRPTWKSKKPTTFKRPGHNQESNKQGGCYVCGRTGHKAYQCHHRKGSSSSQSLNSQANIVEGEEVQTFTAMVTEINMVEGKAEWIIDSGATKHFCADKNMFADFDAVTTGEVVYMGNASSAQVMGKGKINLKLTSGKSLSLMNVLFVPSLRRNLISASLLIKAGMKLVLEAGKLVITKNEIFVGKGYMSGGLFVIETSISLNDKASPSSYLVESCDTWHARLGHLNSKSLKLMKKMNLLPNLLGNIDLPKCHVCVEAKFNKKPFKTVNKRASCLLELIHSDLADFKGIESKGGKNYYITFVDDYSRYTKVYLLRTKDEAEHKFIAYKAEVENQLDRRIKRLRTDRGGEYSSKFLNEMCELNGIIHETTAPYSPQQNGIAERKNRTLKNMMNAMILSSGLPNNLWGEAVLAANHILNRVPHKKLDKTPYELWKGYAPNLEYLRVWGCLAKVGILAHKRSVVGSKTFDCVFIGYASNSAAYRFMRIDDRSICEYRDAVFFENDFPLNNSRYGNAKSSTTSNNSGNSLPPELPLIIEQDSDSELIVRRSKRQKTATSFGPEFLTYFLSEDLNCSNAFNNEFGCMFMLENDPRTYEEAMKSVDSSFWKEAIQSELESIKSNHTWDLVDLPTGSKAIGCKWIFKRKLKTDGTVERFKARLVIKGFTQKPGLDYFDTYSPVTKISTIRILFALASINHMHVHQMDVKTAFLNGELNEEIYMEVPPGSSECIVGQKVCRLRKSLYGLKQAPKQWYEKFHQTISSFGFVANSSDTCVYSKLFESECVILCLYVDDMLIFSSNLEAISETKTFLSSHFEMKDMGEVDVILGVKVIKLVNRLSRYTSNPSSDHWIALRRVLKYLKGTANWGLKFKGYPPILEGYTDANWVTSKDDVSSTSGFVFTLGGAAVSWKSTKQTCIARSTMESEFIALDTACQEAEWIRSLQADIPVWKKPTPAVSLHCDSQAAIHVAKSTVYNGKKRHLHLRHETVRSLLESGVISMEYVKSEKNLADPLTKGLCRKLVHETAVAMGLGS